MNLGNGNESGGTITKVGREWKGNVQDGEVKGEDRSRSSVERWGKGRRLFEGSVDVRLYKEVGDGKLLRERQAEAERYLWS